MRMFLYYDQIMEQFIRTYACIFAYVAKQCHPLIIDFKQKI